MKTFKKIFNKRDTKGITLIALVITIIVLLILSGVVINSIMGQDGALDKAAQARLENRRGEAKDAASVIVTELIQDYYDKKFVDRVSNADNPGDYVLEVLEEDEKTDGNYIVSVENDILEVEDEDDVLATGTVTEDGVIVWDGTPRAVTASVNPWNNMANESEVAPADLFYYEITEEPQVASKVDGVKEKAKVADNSGNIKVADAETENLGKAKITGINVEKLAEAYSSDEYNKRYEYESYNSSENNGYGWKELFERYYNAGVIGEYDEVSSGTYYYYVSGSGDIVIHNTSNIYHEWDSYYSLRCEYFWEEIEQNHSDYIDYEWNNDSSYYINNYASSLAEDIYNNNHDTNWIGYDEEKGEDIYENYWHDDNWNEIYRCGNSYDQNEIKTILTNYIKEHSENYKMELIRTRFLNNRYDTVSLTYEEENRQYFTTNKFSPYFIKMYSTTPSYFNKFVFPHIYEKDGRKYEITSIDLTANCGNYEPDLVFPYVDSRITKIIIPNSVTSVKFGYGNSDYTSSLSLNTILLPGGMGRYTNYSSIFGGTYTYPETVVVGEGITEINASSLPSSVKDIYLPKSLTKISGNWTGYYQKRINVHYAGKKGAWSRVTGNKPNADKVTFRSRYSD